MSWFLVKLSWKNIWRNKRRTCLTAGAMAIGVMWIVFSYNYYDSIHAQLIDNAISYQSGHFAIGKTGYHERYDAHAFLLNAEPYLNWLKKDNRVKAIATRIHGQGMLSSPYASANIRFTGINPEKEKATTRISQNIISGSYFSSGEANAVVLGVGLAKQLQAEVGSKLVGLTQGVDGSIGNELFEVVGIFDTQSQIDKIQVFILLPQARSFLSLSQDAFHEIAVVLKDDKGLSKYKSTFDKTFPGHEADLVTWMDLQKHLMGLITLNHAAARLLMFIILSIVVLGIANAILMGLLERTREFGVMMAIGTSKLHMVGMVISETILLCLVGIFVGNALGIAVTLYFSKYGFDLQWLTEKEIAINGAVIDTVSYPTVALEHSIFISLVVLMLSMIAVLIPLQYISRLKTVKALNG